MVLFFVEIDLDGLAFMYEGEGQSCPAVGPRGGGGIAMLGQAQTGETENDRLPDCTTTGIVNTFSRIAAQIFHVYQSP